MAYDWDSKGIEKRLSKAQKIMKVTGNEQLQKILTNVEAGVEARKNWSNIKRRKQVKKGMRNRRMNTGK